MNITFILTNGTERVVSFSEGETLLNLAEKNNIPIHSNCEGFSICGSCHVIIENLSDKLSEISDMENDALDNVQGVCIKSRLACQINLTKDLDGMRVKLVD